MEIISATKLISSVTSSDEIEKQTSAGCDDDEKAKRHMRNERKLRHYVSECTRYGLSKITMMRRFMHEEAGADNLNLDFYGLSTLQCEIMFDAFKMRPITPLTVVSLKDNDLEHFCCHSLAAFIQMSVSLRELTLEGCKFGDEGARILSDGISISTSILHFNLARCSLSDDGGEAIVQSFLINDVCNELNLAGNGLSLKSAKAFAEVFAENKSLKRLDVSHNMLHEDEAIVKLLKGLAHNTTLEELNLSWNALGGDESLAKALSKSIKSSKLRILKMENNRLSTVELRRIGIGLKRSQTIEEAYIGGNLIAADVDAKLIGVFKSSSPLRLLSFGSWFHLSQEAFKLLEDICESKPLIKVIFQNVLFPNPPREVNMLDLFADRFKFLANSPKNRFTRRDMGAFMVQLQGLEDAYLSKSNFLKMLKKFKARSDEDLIEAYVDACSVKVSGELRLDVHLMANHYLRRHPKPSQ